MSIKSQRGYAICDFLFCQIHCRNLMVLCISICILSTARVLCPYHNEICFIDHTIVADSNGRFEMRSLCFVIDADFIVIIRKRSFIFAQFFARIGKNEYMRTAFVSHACLQTADD